MPVYVALLRGINIGPHKRMKMEKLRASCEGLKLEQVKTYVQSGNVVFRAAKQNSATLAKKIEAMIIQEFGFPSRVIVRTNDELEETVRKNPFPHEAEADSARVCVAFLSKAPVAAALKKLDTVARNGERFQPSGDDIYLHYPNGYAETKLTTNFIEKALSVEATIRNWRTVESLHAMARECGP